VPPPAFSSLSSSFFFFIFSLSPLLLSSNCGRVRQGGSRTGGVGCIGINMRAMGACVSSYPLLRSEAPKLASWRDQNAKTNKAHCSFFWKVRHAHPGKYKGSVYDAFNGQC
jgi:hypothetical protein